MTNRGAVLPHGDVDVDDNPSLTATIPAVPEPGAAASRFGGFGAPALLAWRCGKPGRVARVAPRVAR